MESAKHIEHLNALRAQRIELEAQTQAAMEAAVNAFHPLKIGDVVEVTGYSYRGKKMRVEKRSVAEFGWGENIRWEWIAFGKILKKDGTESSQRGEWRREIIE